MCKKNKEKNLLRNETSTGCLEGKVWRSGAGKVAVIDFPQQASLLVFMARNIHHFLWCDIIIRLPHNFALLSTSAGLK